MPKRIPIAAVKRFARAHKCRQVVIVAWDGEFTHVGTYGATAEDAAQAASGGKLVKAAMGLTEELRPQPIRLRKGKEPRR